MIPGLLIIREGDILRRYTHAESGGVTKGAALLNNHIPRSIVIIDTVDREIQTKCPTHALPKPKLTNQYKDEEKNNEDAKNLHHQPAITRNARIILE